jgi:hypothetical protein
MKLCDYCGRENEETSAFCRECGTRFPQKPVTVEQDSRPARLPDPELIKLDEIPGAFEVKEGFSRPDWGVIRTAIERNAVGPEEQKQAWEESVLQWIEKLKEDLGGEYRLQRSPDCVMLSGLGDQAASRLLNFANHAIAEIRDFLGEIAWGSFRGKQVVLIFTEEDDYYQYLSGFFAEGTHPTSIGVHLKAGLPPYRASS